jgi:hypothetical protein
MSYPDRLEIASIRRIGTASMDRAKVRYIWREVRDIERQLALSPIGLEAMLLRQLEDKSASTLRPPQG